MTLREIARLRAVAMQQLAVHLDATALVPAADICEVCDLAAKALRMREVHSALVAAVRTRDEAYRCPDVDADASEERAYHAHLKAVVALERGE